MSQLEQLRAAMGRAGVDALWISDAANVRYLSGFTSGKDGKVLVTPQGETLYTDARYTVQAAQESRLPQFIARPPATLEHAAPGPRVPSRSSWRAGRVGRCRTAWRRTA